MCVARFNYTNQDVQLELWREKILLLALGGRRLWVVYLEGTPKFWPESPLSDCVKKARDGLFRKVDVSVVPEDQSEAALKELNQQFAFTSAFVWVVCHDPFLAGGISVLRKLVHLQGPGTLSGELLLSHRDGTSIAWINPNSERLSDVTRNYAAEFLAYDRYGRILWET